METAAGKGKLDPVVWWVCGAMALVLAALAAWGIVASSTEQDESDIRVCVMSRAMSDPSVSYETAKRECRQ